MRLWFIKMAKKKLPQGLINYWKNKRKSKSKTNEVRTMARRRSRKSKSYSRSRSKGSSSSPLMAFGTGAGYGVVRSKVVSAASPVINMLPFGVYNDNVALGALAWYGSKNSSGIVKSACMSILSVEGALTGVDATQGTSTTNAGIYVI